MSAIALGRGAQLIQYRNCEDFRSNTHTRQKLNLIASSSRPKPWQMFWRSAATWNNDWKLKSGGGGGGGGKEEEGEERHHHRDSRVLDEIISKGVERDYPGVASAILSSGTILYLDLLVFLELIVHTYRPPPSCQEGHRDCRGQGMV